jgi:hypothetical protein
MTTYPKDIAYEFTERGDRLQRQHRDDLAALGADHPN